MIISGLFISGLIALLILFLLPPEKEPSDIIDMLGMWAVLFVFICIVVLPIQLLIIKALTLIIL